MRLNEISMLKKGQTIRICRFARLLNYARTSDREFKRILQFLVRGGLVAIQQGGFVADSMHHHKLVAILRPFELDRFKRLVLTQTNYNIGEFKVHKTKTKRICQKCKYTISIGERYGAKISLSQRKTWRTRRRAVFAYEIVCLPCLIENASIDDIEAEIW